MTFECNMQDWTDLLSKLMTGGHHIEIRTNYAMFQSQTHLYMAAWFDHFLESSECTKGSVHLAGHRHEMMSLTPGRGQTVHRVQ